MYFFSTNDRREAETLWLSLMEIPPSASSPRSPCFA